jgi:hypothetical protein
VASLIASDCPSMDTLQREPSSVTGLSANQVSGKLAWTLGSGILQISSMEAEQRAAYDAHQRAMEEASVQEADHQCLIGNR